MQRLDVARHHECDLALDPFCVKPGVDQVLVLAADDHRDMPRREEDVTLLQLCRHRVAAPHRQRVAVGVEQLTVKTLESVADRDHQVDGAGKLRGKDRRSPPWHDVDPDVRCKPRDLLHQGRHQQFDREIRHHQAELPFALGGVESIGNKESAHLVERLRERRAQRQRPRRQLHPRAGSYQKRIADQLAQPLQGMAGGRLREPDPHRCAADARFPQQRVEGDQQVEVKRIQIHQANIYHAIYRLEE
jgi:hypothetical protein